SFVRATSSTDKLADKAGSRLDGRQIIGGGHLPPRLFRRDTAVPSAATQVQFPCSNGHIQPGYEPSRPAWTFCPDRPARTSAPGHRSLWKPAMGGGSCSAR